MLSVQCSMTYPPPAGHSTLNIQHSPLSLLSPRYARHLPVIGEEGQRRLRAGSVLIVGMGGLGSPVSIYLAAAGVGRIGIVDFDVVDETNLHRQVLYGTSDVGRPKLEAARERLADLNPDVQVVEHD